MKKILLLLIICPLFSYAQTTCSNGPNTIVVDAIQTAPITCYGSCSGAATVSISGGSGNYNYSWTGPSSFTATTQNIAALCTGTYTVTVTDNTFGIVCSDQVTISQPPQLNVTISVTNCSAYGSCDGSATLTISGGTSPYTIIWYNSSMAVIPGQTGLTLANRCAGNYYYSVTDAGNCPPDVGPGLHPFTIGQPASTLAITATFGTTACGSDYGFECSGGIAANASGGTPPYTYYLSGMSSGTNTTGFFQFLCVGGYTVTVIDAVGSSASISGSVLPNWPSPVLNFVVVTPPSCVGVCDASIVLNASGGLQPYSYSINATGMPAGYQSGNTFNGLCGGLMYNATVSDSHGCKHWFPVSGTVPDATPVGLTISNITHESYAGAANGSVTANATHPLVNNYTLNGSNSQTNGNYSGLAPGNYTLCAFTSSGCSQCLNFTVNPGPACALTSNDQMQNVSCYNACDGTINLNVGGHYGPFTVDWNISQTGTSVSSLCDGLYTYVITDSVGCTYSDSIEITEPGEVFLSLSSTGTINANSSDGSISANATNGSGTYEYSIDNGITWQSSGNFDSLTAGGYLICVMDSLSCMVCDSVTVNAGPVCNLITNDIITNISCFGECDGMINVGVGGNNGSYTITWNTLQTGDTISNLCEGNYSYTVEDSTGCVFNNSITISAPTVLVLDTAYTHATCEICPNGTITLTGSGGTAPYQYSIDGINWQSSGFFDSLYVGSYMGCVMDGGGCIVCQQINISEPSGINEYNNGSVSVFPVPAKDEIFILSDNSIKKIQLSDISGKIIYSEIISGEVTRYSINIQNYPEGIYILGIISDKGNYFVRVVIEN